MSLRLRHLLLLGAVCVNFEYASGQEGAPPTPSQRAIPYKTDVTPMEAQGVRVTLVLAGLLLAAAFGLYVLRKKRPHLGGIESRDASLKVVDRLRLNQRSTLYRVRFDGHEFWIAQCGDKLVQLDPNLSAHPTAGGLE